MTRKRRLILMSTGNTYSIGSKPDGRVAFAAYDPATISRSTTGVPVRSPGDLSVQYPVSARGDQDKDGK